MTGSREALPWFKQASSDLRVARWLLTTPEEAALEVGDQGCHCTAMCSQSVEKSIKGYVIVNGSQPSMDHRPDKYLPLLLRDDKLLRYRRHRPRLAKLFDANTRNIVRRLFDLTPGGLGGRNDVPNTEYPWTEGGVWRHAPAKAEVFARRDVLKEWLGTTRRVHETLYKLAMSAIQGEEL